MPQHKWVDFYQRIWSGVIRVVESWQARVCMRVFSTLMSWSNENKSCTRVDESCQARVCRRVFSTLMSWSNENKSCMRVDESWQARVYIRRGESSFYLQILFERGGITKKTQSVVHHEMVSTIKEQLCPGLEIVYSIYVYFAVVRILKLCSWTVRWNFLILGTEFWDSLKTIKFLQENEYFHQGGEQVRVIYRWYFHVIFTCLALWKHHVNLLLFGVSTKLN